MLKVGDTITLSHTRGEQTDTYKCRIVELNTKYIYIDYPINTSTGKSTFFTIGTHFNAKYIRKDQQVFTFKTHIIGKTNQRIPMISLVKPAKDKFVKVQRRQFVRIETSVDVAVHSTQDDFPPFLTVTSDLSAGGAALIMPQDVEVSPNTEMSVWFVLPYQSGEYKYLKIPCKVIRMIGGDDYDRNKATIEFLDIKETERQMLIRYCFEQQVAMRKREL
ncbi:flagellar brake protein [Cytobacillus sp. IB215665]|uniref:flagellar brake protein n=1 Tax=Cytobacillus sp. IB215665 TaxID=3097357 RepID=UPI002A10E55D|nr:flagellar brake domain-containing protein [Cytobacillus sp. IB215665]MDX8364831.1 flagellar brake domain-containing protein [Cytobacillus sp. IB215665]